MSSRFATERVVLAQDDLVDPSQREAVWLLMEWPHGEKAATDLPRPRCRRTCHGASSFGESSSGGAPNGCTRTPRESLGWNHYEGRSFRGWNHHVSMVLVCFAFIVAERSRAFPPRPENCHAKASHRHDGADGNPPGAGTSGIPSSLCAWPSRASWPHGYHRCPLCHRPRSMGPPGAHAREHRRTTPF